MSIENKNKFSFFYFLLLLSLILLIHTLFFRKKIEEIPYSTFKKFIGQPGRIEKCIINQNSIRGVYIKDEEVYKQTKKRKNKIGIGETSPKEKAEEDKFFINLFEDKKGRAAFTTVRVHKDEKLIELLQKNNVPFQGEIDNNWGAILISWLIPIGLIVLFWIIIMKRMNNYGRDVMSFGKTKSKINIEQNTKTSFADVAGCDEAKEELSEIVEFLKSPKKFEELGGRIPKGALLVGPPGTGKTLLARAVAGEAGVPFLNISGSEFVEMFVGVGASRVRDLFNQAKSKPPCIIFIDEIDAVGRHRGAGLGGGHDEREQTLNQLLAEMDGFETNKGIIVLAATNRPDILDPALLRPGRFDRQIIIDQPDIKGRKEILEIHSKNKPLAEEIDLEVLAQRTPGFSGADLANVMNEAALLAARKNKKKIEQEDIAEAVERVIAGPERKSRIISPKEKKITAYHELGHALITELHPHGDRVHKVSIIPRGPSLGYTLHMPDEDKHLMTKEEILARICISLGGRVAEEICLGITSTGAQQDLLHVTDLARSLVARYGMSEKMGPLAYEREDGYVFLGKNIERKSYFGSTVINEIDKEVKELVTECYDKTHSMITENREILEKMVEVMLKQETMEGEEFKAIYNKLKENIDVPLNELVDEKKVLKIAEDKEKLEKQKKEAKLLIEKPEEKSEKIEEVKSMDELKLFLEDHIKSFQDLLSKIIPGEVKLEEKTKEEVKPEEKTKEEVKPEEVKTEDTKEEIKPEEKTTETETSDKETEDTEKKSEEEVKTEDTEKKPEEEVKTEDAKEEKSGEIETSDKGTEEKEEARTEKADTEPEKTGEKTKPEESKDKEE